MRLPPDYAEAGGKSGVSGRAQAQSYAQGIGFRIGWVVRPLRIAVRETRNVLRVTSGGFRSDSLALLDHLNLRKSLRLTR